MVVSFKKVLLLSLALLLVVPAAALAEDVPGVTDDTITVGITTPLSGPAALWGATGMGAKAWADYVNDQGGVHGRKIKVILKDDGYNPARAMSNLQEMKNQVFTVLAVLGSAPCNATKDFFPENKIPLIHGYGNVRIYANQPPEKRKWYFVAYPDYEDEAEYLVTWAIENQQATNVAAFFQNDEYGFGNMKGLQKALGAAGGKVKLVSEVSYEVTERALATHAQKLKESGADSLFIFATPTQGAIITKEVAKLDWAPKKYVTFPLADPIMSKIGGPAWEGTFMTTSGQMSLPGTPSADKVWEILLKYDPKLEGKVNLSIFGAVTMMHFVKALEIAGKDLTREGLIAAMEQIKDWHPEGMGSPVIYGPDRHHGVNSVQMAVAKGDQVVPIDAEKFKIFDPRF